MAKASPFLLSEQLPDSQNRTESFKQMGELGRHRRRKQFQCPEHSKSSLRIGILMPAILHFAVLCRGEAPVPKLLKMPTVELHRVKKEMAADRSRQAAIELAEQSLHHFQRCGGFW